MKNQGLQNRFPDGTKAHWAGFDECVICSKNCWDTLHHIISPSSRLYVPGDHNKSILNSAPIHNFAHPKDMENMADKKYCHYGNEAFLYTDETICSLLVRVRHALISLGYTLKPRDLEFLKIYGALYTLKPVMAQQSREWWEDVEFDETVDKPVENLLVACW